MIDLFGGLGTTATVLHEFGAVPTETERAEKFGRAAIIYTMGGHTPTLLNSLRANGTDLDVREAAHAGKMLAGDSAGALLTFSTALICPAKQPAKEVWDFESIPALGILGAAATVHANQVEATKSRSRLDAMLELFPAMNQQRGFGIENGAAMLLSGDSARIVRSREDSEIYVISMTGEAAVSRIIEDDADFRTIMRDVTITV